MATKTKPSPELQPTQPNIEMWAPDKLKPHPRNAEFFPPLTGQPQADLKADISVNGIRTPLTILPDGTIIAGEQRRNIAIELNITSVPVVVRHDLEGNDAAVLETLLLDNVNRRQLTPLQRARCAEHLHENAVERRRSGELAVEPGTSTRDYLGKLLGIGGRQLDRLLQVLETPLPVQQAVDAGHLPIDVACRVAGLPSSEQAAIGEQILTQGLEHAKKIISAALPGKQSQEQGKDRSFSNFMRQLTADMAEFELRLEEVVEGSEEQLAEINKALAFFSSVHAVNARKRKSKESPVNAEKQLAKPANSKSPKVRRPRQMDVESIFE